MSHQTTLTIRAAPIGTAVLLLAVVLASLAPVTPTEAALAPPEYDPFVDAQIDAGYGHTCAIDQTGQVWCWGWNGDGQLGNGETTDSTVPVEAAGIDDAVAVEVGGDFTCAIRSDRSVWCWGYNADGQLGDGTTTNRGEPAPVHGLRDARSITATSDTVCALQTDGTAQCWGDNRGGQLGDGTTEHRPLPVDVRGLTDLVEIETGSKHTCARDIAGSVWCWGGNSFGQLGYPTPNGRSLLPAQVPNLDQVRSISTASNHTCASHLDESVSCWGFNKYGQLGDGTTTSRTRVGGVEGLTGATSVDVGGSASCARTAPQPVAEPASASGSIEFTAAPERPASAWCWGSNSNGQLGDGTTTDKDRPTQVAHSLKAPTQSISDVHAVSVGTYHACAVRADGEVWCWGSGSDGQLGIGTTESHPYPVRVPVLRVRTSTLTCDGHEATHVGTSGADTVYGTNGHDVFVMQAGDDRVYGLAGDDVICLGGGDDRAFAGAGDDTVFGGDGSDKIRGGFGRNTIYGEGGAVDFLKGGHDDDRIYGGPGHDRIRGSEGDDDLRGGDQHDWIWGGPGRDDVHGGNGDDVLAGGAGGSDLCAGGSGDDFISPSCEHIDSRPIEQVAG